MNTCSSHTGSSKHGGMWEMRRHSQRRTVTSLLVAVVLTAVLAALSIATTTSQANAQTQDGDAISTEEIDVDGVVARTDRFLRTLTAIDLNNDGFADYDSSADGVAEIQVDKRDDLAIQPGQREFTGLVRDALATHTATTSDAAVAGECSSILLSFDGSGNLIDAALTVGSDHGGGSAGVALDLFPQDVTGAAAFTSANPFVVADKVLVIGQSGPATNTGVGASTTAQQQGWELSSAELVLADGHAMANDVVVSELLVDDYARIAGLAVPVGLFPVDATIDTDGAVLCHSTGWVQFEQGSPLLTNVGIAASGLSAIGLLGLFTKARPAWAWKKEDEA